VNKFSVFFLVILFWNCNDVLPTKKKSDNLLKATFAGGCFWCMEPPFDELKGVVYTISGYSGGDTPNPTYETVSAGFTGHAEVIQIEYDPKVINYEKLLEVFWRNIDPLAKDSQFCDKGNQYRSAIFYHSDEQRILAEKSKQGVLQKFKKVETTIEEIKNFTPAEDYHQDYYLKNPLRYKYYRTSCGRDARLKELWN
jgi:peptide-methionine (S)-S-oxide reductase